MPKQTNKAPSFEEGLDRLEQIVKDLEQGELDLEKSLELFEQGVELSKSCHKQLEEAEQKVEILLKKQGRVEAEPFGLEDGEPEA